MLSDTHLGLQDAREEPFAQYSKRMAGAYVKTRHAKSGGQTSPQESFIEGIAIAQKNKADLLALPGDLFSFPSEANVEWAAQKLQESGLTWLYTAGNHDWHYEGMEGTSQALRETWIQKRLLPLYQGSNPLISFRDINGLRIIAVDNSTYEILPDQLDEFRRLIRAGLPTLLFIHIPLYALGRPLGFGCGHPEWGAKSDKNFTIERRPKWREAGHTQTTMDFHREVLASSNLLAVFAGHTHSPSLDLLNGIPQVVSDDNASGGRLDIEVLPFS
ncbi:metallophosphoesterase [Roseimicrobium sp. ORNL1]|uniref:metallophosphoesterase family protein n=1 Tax=Roseimicrobium sp. ORNL1 TaxID=2711231 RepID=UPI0013E0F4D3|nr:metallophosphoesterase [Roseimicrobium sp. ORNL1]QIF03163.1 metallophosphoesterase [Roseimicrobium sp. ORNL1]